MKRILCLVLVLTMVCALLTFMPVNAATIVESGECGAQGDNVKWTLDSDGILTISGNGDMEDYNFLNFIPWYSSRPNVKAVEIKDGVTNIGNFAFYECGNLTNINIPNSVISIGECAFESCTNLTSVSMGNSVRSIGYGAFQECNNLTKINIPDSLNYIGDIAFWGCSSLKNINIPPNLTSIGVWVFGSCGNLNIEVSPQNETYSSIDGVLFNNNETEILTYAKDEIQPDYTIPYSVTSIGGSAFYCCENLTNVNIPNSVISIGDSAFLNCKKLTNVSIPNSIASIDRRAFDGCTGLKNVSIGRGVTSIGNDAFSSCGSVNIEVLEQNNTYSSIDGVLFNKEKTQILVYAKDKIQSEYNIPDSVTSISCC